MAAFDVEPAFEGVGQEEGLTLWRIEEMKVVLQPEATGKFYEGDSYILLATTRVRNKISNSIHFWLGAKTTQDEMGVAAYKAVELDDALGGAPAQHREVQGHESSLFMSYFKHAGVEYLPGGVDSGFTKVERDSYRTRLLHLKGKRTVRCNEVPCAASSLNVGDVFVLDMGLKLFLWSGVDANMFEKAKGVEMVQGIKDERGARPKVTFMQDDPKNADFWEALGGFTEVTAKGKDDEAAEREAASATHLYLVKDSGSEDVGVAGDKLTRDLLKSSNVFLLDVGHEVFVWVGKETELEDKKNGVPFATKFVTAHGRPNSTPIVRVAQGFETAAFKGHFQSWSSGVPDFTREVSSGVALSASGPTDMRQLSMSMRSLKTDNEEAVDDGSGKLEIWRVEDFKRVPWPEEQFGQLYGGDSYVMLYTYLVNGKEMYIVYFWQGRESSQDEKGASALLAKEMDDELKGSPVQVRVVQGKEPKHLRSLFKGRLVVHSGGAASGFKNREDKDSTDTDGIALFHVKGSTPGNTYGVQVPEMASSLNSGDSFVLVTPTNVFTWQGKNCSEEELEVAQNISQMLEDHLGVSGRETSVVVEGEEPDAFWEALGGKGEYPETSELEASGQPPRLFQVSNATGKLTVDEVENFDQEDLCADDVMLLDSFVSVFAWIGPRSNEQERREAMTLAQEYISTAGDGRDKDTPIVQVHAGAEPPLFTQHFRGWDPELEGKLEFVDPFEAKMAKLKEEQAKQEAEEEEAPGTITMEDIQAKEEEAAAPPASSPPAAGGGGGKCVPYEELKGYGKTVEGVDPSCREQYLSDAEFREVFGFSKADFAKMPKWKQVSQKKAKELF